MMAKQRPPKDKINATSQDAAVRKKDTAIAARTFKILPYSISHFNAWEIKSTSLSPANGELHFFRWSV